MHFPRAIWLLVAGIGTVFAVSDILEVNLVFPQNDTYAPNDSFPIVFAFRNSERARYLNPSLEYLLWDENGDEALPVRHELRWVNWTDQDTYFAYKYSRSLRRESFWKVLWTLSWDSCAEDSTQYGSKVVYNTTTKATWFTTKNSAPKLDPIAATANRTCLGQSGVAINVSDRTMYIPGEGWSGGQYTNHTCAVVAASPTPTTNPCRSQIGNATVASMEASLKAWHCNITFGQAADCPDKNNVAQKLAVAGISCLLALSGALSFFLM
ncbi:hypothetical protein N7508_000928 [Penicillium antarcticum]|uniref:uncharacterized protein n=1 Tax=Penicillium antarcticum TaxID=416450 RepID=UPI00239F1D59|nr:uncharacterized protein N7508_000928 [Penicillium antarcticum]KAJ5320645.1 hypothetical protein N7508_000928 [Penicillium antarcticum]